ncbi:MAG: hypothetical protein FWD59_10030 [Micrococcales bacterium]|nr:hypothetical protein [Micrococcales bacterium]
MPTTLKRTTITHTPPVAHLLAEASRRWPGEPDATLAINLMAAGARSLETPQQRATRIAEGVAHRLAHTLGDAIPETFLDDNRAEWPS